MLNLGLHEINNIRLTGFGEGSIKKKKKSKIRGEKRKGRKCRMTAKPVLKKKQNKLNDNTMAIYYGP